MSGSGTLHVAATPIGHLGDASPRLREVLAASRLVLCEDTRRTGRLLQALGVEARLRTCHEHDEERRIPEVLELLAGGDDVALVSDAGTPLVSDPGFRLVAAAHAAGHRVSPVPGPSAPLAALSVAGLATDRFVFEGFLPRRSGARRRRLAELASEPRTLVFLETPHRVVGALQDLASACGPDRKACLCRELTKLHEEVRPGTLRELHDRLAGGPVRGEIVLVVAGAPTPEPPSLDELVREVRERVREGGDERDALREVARRHGVPRRELYRLVKLDGPARPAVGTDAEAEPEGDERGSPAPDRENDG